MDETTINESAEVIAVELGLNASYLLDDDALHFDPFSITTGLAVLWWFLDGVRDALFEQAAEAGKPLAKRLIDKLKRLGSSAEAPSEGDVRAAIKAARAASDKQPVARITVTVEMTESVLRDYLLDRGMPEEDAVRFAERVRDEAVRQAQFPDGGTTSQPGGPEHHS